MIQRIKVPVAQLDFDLKNPRFAPQTTQREVLEHQVKELGTKLVALLGDIAKHGLNPLELPLVARNGKRFRVLEGNRRLCALKLIAKPALIESLEIPAGRAKKLREAVAAVGTGDFRSIFVAVADSDEEGRHWIELKHTGENAGAGVVVWTGVQTARFSAVRPALALLDAVIHAKIVRADEVGDSTKFNLTNLERLLNDPVFRTETGIHKDRAGLGALPVDETHRARLRRAVLDVANGGRNGGISVSQIKSKSDREAYIRSLTLPESSSTAISGTIPTKGTGSDAPSRRNRSKLIPRACTLAISVPRLRDIFLELKTKLDVTSSPNAVGVLFRVFLEMTCDAYAERKKIPLGGDTKLSVKMEKVCTHMTDAGASKRSLQAAKRVASERGIGGTDWFHSLVHNRDEAPRAVDLTTTWDNLQPFFVIAWTGP